MGHSSNHTTDSTAREASSAPSFGAYVEGRGVDILEAFVDGFRLRTSPGSRVRAVILLSANVERAGKPSTHSPQFLHALPASHAYPPIQLVSQRPLFSCLCIPGFCFCPAFNSSQQRSQRSFSPILDLSNRCYLAQHFLQFTVPQIPSLRQGVYVVESDG